ncbi:MAG: NAD-dependent epimerase/dehydratase family protein [Ilumatobacteraceae bacterium]
MRVFVTGAAGFIGSNVCDTLLAEGHQVTGYDNLSTGRLAFLADAFSHPQFQLVEADLADQPSLTARLDGHDAVIHLAANADVRFGWDHPRRDIEQNAVLTQNVLEAMRETGVRRILISSTGSVYGDCDVIPTPETAPFPLQTSLYGVSKLAAEALVSAYAEAGHVSGTIFRFVSILGPRYTHGHVIDFFAQLQEHPDELRILGDGGQRKSYLHVSDCVRAVAMRLKEDPGIEVLNLGVDSYCEVRDSAKWISETLGVNPTFTFAGGDRGWIGDSPFIFLDTSRARALGWEPRVTIHDAVEDTVRWLRDNPWVLDAAITNDKG